MRAFLLEALLAYKRYISPMLPMSCRYVPTCSEYAMEAIAVYGSWRGSRMAMARLLRCHPFAAGGHDPVPLPERKENLLPEGLIPHDHEDIVEAEPDETAPERNGRHLGRNS